MAVLHDLADQICRSQCTHEVEQPIADEIEMDAETMRSGGVSAAPHRADLEAAGIERDDEAFENVFAELSAGGSSGAGSVGSSGNVDGAIGSRSDKSSDQTDCERPPGSMPASRKTSSTARLAEASIERRRTSTMAYVMPSSRLRRMRETVVPKPSSAKKACSDQQRSARTPHLSLSELHRLPFGARGLRRGDHGKRGRSGCAARVARSPFGRDTRHGGPTGGRARLSTSSWT